MSWRLASNSALSPTGIRRAADGARNRERPPAVKFGALAIGLRGDFMSWSLALLFFWFGSCTACAVLAYGNRLEYKPSNMAMDMGILAVLAFIATR